MKSTTPATVSAPIEASRCGVCCRFPRTCCLVILIVRLIYGCGVKQSISDRTQQQAQEDHIAIQEMRISSPTLGKQEAVLATKVDLLISDAQVHRDAQ